MTGPEKPWMVVTIGARACWLKASGSQSRWLCTRSNSADRARACDTCRASQTRPSSPASWAYPCGQTPSRAAAVTESSVANKVTSTPRATRPSVSRLATDSHGP